MADNRLELVVEVDTKTANANIKSVNAALGSMEQAAVRSARGASQGIDGMTMSMAKAVAAGQAIYGAVMAAARALQSLTLGALHSQDALGKTAQKVGLSVSELSALRHAAELSDVSFETLTVSLGRFSSHVAKGSKELEALGVATHRQDGMLRATSEILADVADRFARMPDGVSKTALAIELFGKSGKDMIPLLNGGRAGLEEMAREAKDLGRVIDEDTAKRAEHLNDNITRLKGALEGLSFEVAQRAVPAAIRITDAIIKWVRDGGMERLVQYLRDTAEWAKNIGLWIAGYSVVRHVLELASAMRTAALAAGGLNVALLANPWGLAAAGIATLGVVLYREKQRMDDFQESAAKAAEKAALLKKISEGATLEQLKKQGYDETAIKSVFGGPERATGARRIVQDVDVEELVRQREKAAEAEKRAAEILQQARESELTGVAKVALEYEKYRRELGLTAKAQRDLAEAERIRIQLEAKQQLKSAAAEQLEAAAREAELRRKSLSDQLRIQSEFENETLELAQQTARERLRYEETAAEQMRDAQLRQLDLIGAQTVEQQIALQERRLQIEEEYLLRRFALRADELRRESELEIATMEAIARARGIAEEQIAARRDAILKDYAERARQMEAETQAAIDAARDNAAIRQAQIIRDQNQRIFDAFKRQAEGVFDALLTRSQSVWSAMGNALKTALLTAIKEVVTSRIAALLMQLFAGVRIPVGGGRIAGLGAAGALPAIAGAMGPIPYGAAGGMGTPPFIPTGGGGFGGFGGLLGGFGGLLNLATVGGLGLMLGGMARGNALMTILGSSLGLARVGIMGTQLGMVGGAGAGLMAAGLMRGGWGGFGMSTVGGAILGFQFGGPLGALIGAGVGAIAGAFRMLFKSAQDKAREKIKALYGVDMRDKTILSQIVSIAKQAFGGNLDAAIRSPQVRDLIELYALSTGQSTAGLPATVKPVTLAQSGGALFQQSAGFALDRIGAGAPSGGAPIVINISVPGAKEFFEQETLRVVVENPRAVQSATMSAMRANSGRRESAALQLSPGLITA
jgi:hypothetical protein